MFWIPPARVDRPVRKDTAGEFHKWDTGQMEEDIQAESESQGSERKAKVIIKTRPILRSAA